jgi:hypothetical protein
LSDEARRNQESMLERIAELDAVIADAVGGGR